MAKAAYTEQLALYLKALGSGGTSELLVKVALIVFRAQHPTAAETMAPLEELQQLLAPLHPNEHLVYDREALTQALGEYLVEWWSEALERPLTGRDIDQLLGDLPELGVRDALQRAAADHRPSEKAGSA